jgi:hypothetical protein
MNADPKKVDAVFSGWKFPPRTRKRIFPAATMIATLLAVTVWSAVGATPASAALFINEKALPKGMTVQQAQAAAIKAKARASALYARRNAKTQSKINAAMREVAPVRKAMEKAAKSDPEYGKFLDGAHRLMGDSASKSRFQALNNHYRNGAKTVERTFKKAGGEAKEIIAALMKTLEATAYKGLLTFLGLGERPRERNATIASEIRFTAPYAVHDTDTEKSGPGFTTINTSVSNNDAKMSLSAEATSVGLFTSCKARGTAGVFVDVPAGKRKLKAHVYYNYNYRAGVWAALGIGQANLDGLIYLNDVEAGETPDLQYLDFEYSYAVVAWYVESTNDETGYVTLSANVTPGKRYLVNFSIDASALGVGGGGGGSFVTLTPTAIEVEFLD